MPHGEKKKQKTAQSPKDLPIVERCAEKVVQQSDKKKSEAIPICTQQLKKTGRIVQREDGTWVQRQKRRRKTRQRRGRR